LNRRVTADGTGPTKERRVFAQNLAERLKVQKLSGAKLAAAVGLSRDAISSYTSMRSLPSEDTLKAIAKALRCKPVDLIPPMTDDELNTIIEVREYSQPGMKLLIARVPLPEADAMEYASKLLRSAPSGGKKKR